MKSIFATTVISLLMCCSAFAQTTPQPYAIKNDVLGEPTAVFFQNNPLCDPSKATDTTGKLFTRDNHCLLNGSEARGNWTYAEVCHQVVVEFWDGRFAYALMSDIDHSNYSILRGRLVAKFGEPTSTKTVTLQTHGGATFEGEIVMWENTTGIIRLEEYENVENSSLTFMLRDYFNDQMKKHNPTKPSSDM